MDSGSESEWSEQNEPGMTEGLCGMSNFNEQLAITSAKKDFESSV